MPKRRKKHFSYCTGERRRNRVRAFRHAANGKLYLEFRDKGKRHSVRLDTSEEQEAKQQADELSVRLGRIADEEALADQVSVRTLIDRHGKEVSPTKGRSKQDHDRRAGRMFVAFFDAQPEVTRHSSRDPATLDRLDWDRFIEWRRAGRIPGFPKRVRSQTVRYDLQYMVAVLNWAVGVGDLVSNPWGGERRRAERWGAMPFEISPHRPAMTDELRAMLIVNGPDNWQFEAALLLGRATGRRNSSIRQLRWSDIDQERWVVRWRASTDKSGREGMVPLTPDAVTVLKELPSRGIGDMPVFPSEADPTAPTGRHTFQIWLRRAKAMCIRSAPALKREKLQARLKGIGYHAEKRAAVRSKNARQLPPKIQEAFFGTRYETLKNVYDEVGPEDIRDAMSEAGMNALIDESGTNSEAQQRKISGEGG
jgi:hypothetical protein